MILEDRVKHVIAIHFGISTKDCKPDTRIIEDLGADSLDEIELVMELEEEFEIEIDDGKAAACSTVQQIINVVTELVV